jgi:hypothetical protein
MRWTQKLMRDVAREEREELGLGPLDPFDPYALCKEHGIPVYSVSNLAEHTSSAAVHHFTVARSSAWSAALVPLGAARMIIENDAHALVRRRSNIAHELGHHLLEHEFNEVVLGEDHNRQFSAEQEKQAKFMAGELLIPLPAAERMAFDDRDNAYVAERYGVSQQFAQMQMMGQRVRAKRAVSRWPKR